MAGGPMARRMISLAHGIRCSPILISSAPPASPYCAHYVYMYTYLTAYRLYELLLLPNNTAMKQFYTNRSGAKCWLDIYRWGAGMAVTGPIRHIGQNVLQSSFEQEAIVAATQFMPNFVPYRIPRGGRK
jgi:hypothetical protein